MKKIILGIIISFIFTTKIKAEEIYFYEYDENGFLCENSKHIDFIGDFSSEEKIMIIFDNFFIRCNNELIDIKLSDGELKIYVTSDIKSYGGGTAEELRLVKGILANAFYNTEEVKNVTLFIDGLVDFLPEGTMLNHYTREEEENDKDNICYEE